MDITTNKWKSVSAFSKRNKNNNGNSFKNRQILRNACVDVKA